MSATIVQERQGGIGHPPLIIERFLRDREGVWAQIREDCELGRLIRLMTINASLALAGYGAVLGLSNSPLQALSSAVKLPLLFLLTLAISLPTLYLFNLLFGGNLSLRQVMALVLSAITVTACLTVAFAPIALFFLLTAHSYQFFKLLNVVILAITGFAGLRFLLNAMASINRPEPGDDDELAEATGLPRSSSANMPLLRIWLLIYGFIGTQMGWTLRPFFGAPELPFELFRSLEGNFYTDILRSLLELFGR